VLGLICDGHDPLGARPKGQRPAGPRYATELVTAPQSPRQGPASYRQSRFRPSPGDTELVLVRHGESERYLEGRPFPLTGGQGDPPLSADGQEQARRVCARLASVGVDAIYITTLCRTAQTAAPLVGRLGLDPQVEAGLREVYLGEWEGGLYRKMVADGHPIAQQVFAEERWEIVPGAEASVAFADRVRAAIDRLAAAHRGQRVAVFTHGGVIGQALALASRSRPFAFVGADNASISRLVISAEQWTVRAFNDTAHLET
jgi:2,3-bisphosphoglycerate-dependent phosphoglycerate mutase